MSKRADALRELCLAADRAIGFPLIGEHAEPEWRSNEVGECEDCDADNASDSDSDAAPTHLQCCTSMASQDEHARLIVAGNRLQGMDRIETEREKLYNVCDGQYKQETLGCGTRRGAGKHVHCASLRRTGAKNGDARQSTVNG